METKDKLFVAELFLALLEKDAVKMNDIVNSLRKEKDAEERMEIEEAKIDLSALDKRLGRYDNYFDKMLETAPVNQDWNFIVKQLEDNVNELNTYFGWINDVEKYDIQITEQELQRMIQYRNTIRNQIQQIRNYPL